MEIEHIKAINLKTKLWAGGTTTQLFIYPKNAEYKNRDFLFRISTATIETTESIFTKLPEVQRKLMILDGEIKIEHKNRYSKTLKKFDQDEFSGNWDTKSCGKATDFNLMTTGNSIGEIKAITLINSIKVNIKNDINFYALYVYIGEVKFIFNKKSFAANKGDFLIISPKNNELELDIFANIKSEIILTKIKL